MKILSILTAICLSLFAIPASAQSVQQSGSVTPGHVACWTTNGVVQDCGTIAFPFATSIGVIAQGPGICQLSASPSGPFNRICLSASSSGGGITFDNLGGATGSFTFTVDGVAYAFPFTGGGNVVGPNSSTNNGLPLWNGTSGGALKDGNGGTVAGNYTFSGQLTISNYTPSVANLTALEAACTGTSGCPANDQVFSGGVWRLTYGNGNGAEPLWYNTSNSACSLNAGLGDNGLQVPSADSKCWIAQFPASGASVLQFGAIGDGSTDNFTAIQNAISDLPTNGYRIVIPAATAVYCINTTGLTVPTNASADFAPVIVGFGRQSSILSTCNHDLTLLTWKGQYGRLSDLALYGRGANASDTFSFTKPVLHLQNVAGNNKFSNILINGGLYNVQLDGAANSNIFDNDAIFNAYGGAEVYLGNANATYFIRDTFDQSAPTVPLSGANATISAWASGHAYAANTIVSTSGYYIQCINCNGVLTSSGSAPTLKPYNATMNNGSDSLNWQLLAPTSYSAINCDTSCGIVDVMFSDLAGPFSSAVLMSNSASGTAPTGVTLTDTTISFTMGDGVDLFAGSFFVMRGGSIQSCALSSCSGVVTTGAWTTGVIIQGVAFGGNLGYCAIDDAGTSFTFTENNCAATIVGGNGFFAEGAVTKFVVANNNFPNAAGIITVAAAAEDYYSITGNIMGGGTVVDGGTGTHKVIFNPGLPLASKFGGTGVNNGSNTLTLGGSFVTTGSGTPTIGFGNSAVSYNFPGAIGSVSGTPTLLSTAGATLTANPGNETGTSGSGTQAGFGSTCSFTPLYSTRVKFTIVSMLSNSAAGDGVEFNIRYGTGTAPVNGAALTGTNLTGNPVGYGGTGAGANQQFPITLFGIATGLTPGTTYWFDAGLFAITGGTATMANNTCLAQEE